MSIDLDAPSGVVLARPHRNLLSAMTRVRKALNKGLRILIREFALPFTLDGVVGQTFQGLIDQSLYENTLGPGGFMPEQQATLTVPLSEFAPFNIIPHPGMRVTVMNRDWIVSQISQNPQRWKLTLTIAFPKTSDLPAPT